MWSLWQPTQQELLHLVESTLRSQVCTDPFGCRQSAVDPRFITPFHCRHSVAFKGVSLLGHRPSRFPSTRHSIYFLKFWENFERQGQKVFSSTLIGLFSHGFKKCIIFHPPTSSCRHRNFESDHTIPVRSSPSSIERCNCGQWSSTVREGWLLQECVLLATQGDNSQIHWSCPLVRHQDLQQGAFRYLDHTSSRSGFADQLYVAQCVNVRTGLRSRCVTCTRRPTTSTVKSYDQKCRLQHVFNVSNHVVRIGSL